MLLLLLLLILCWLPLFLRAALFLSQSVCPPAPRRPPLNLEPGRETERLVVCPVCDDLNAAALGSVMNAAAGWGRVVVADDGREFKREDLRFKIWPAEGARSGSSPAGAAEVTVFRRGTREGWKAGNVNAALRAHGEGVREFVIMDADTVAAEDFLRALSGRLAEEGGRSTGMALACPCLSPLENSARKGQHGQAGAMPALRGVGFIQARLEWNTSQPGALPRWMGPSVGLHFRTSMRARAARGFTMFHGHAAIICMAACHSAGGLPEIVSEDLGFTLRLRARGWHGVYADDLIAHEDFPPTVAAWRKRQDKWLRGTLECLRKEAGPFLKAKTIPLREKTDMLLNAAWLYLSPLGLAWFAGLALLQPALMERVRQPVRLLKAPAWNLVPDLGHWLDGVRLTLLWSWPVCAVMFFMMLAPLCGSMKGEGGRMKAGVAAEQISSFSFPPSSFSFLRLLRFWIAGSYLWLSSLVVETLSLVAGVVTGRARFDNTGASGHGPGWRVYHANHTLVQVLEAAAGAWFLERTWALANPWLAVPGLALLTAPLVVRRGWDCRAMRWLATLPLLTGLAMVALTVRELLRG